MWALSSQFCFKQAGIPFEEIKPRFDAFTPDSTFKKTVNALTPTGRVPFAETGDHLKKVLSNTTNRRKVDLPTGHSSPSRTGAEGQAVIERV